MVFTKEERMLKVIKKDNKDLDYLPSQISFADRSKLIELSNSMGFPTLKEMNDYLQNHLQLTVSLDEAPLFFRNDVEMMKTLEKKGYAGVDLDKKIVYDRWGVGTEMFSNGFFTIYHPLEGNFRKIKSRHVPSNEEASNFIPEDFNKSVLFENDEIAIKKFQAPDPDKEENTSWMIRDLDTFSGDFLVFTSGYVGIYERTFHLLGFEKFMVLMYENPSLLGEILDKVTDYKIKMAEKTVKLGFKVGHTGDDLGTQVSSIFSPGMFRKILRPRMERLWKVWNDANIPIMFHSCGNITDFIPDLIDMGLSVLEPIQPCMDLEFLKKEYGKYLTFWGGIDTQSILPFGTPEEVKKMARDTIRILGRNGGHIIGPSQDVMEDVPLENVRALVETIVAERENVLKL
jgi:uroporphyrinogen decarboxylase